MSLQCIHHAWNPQMHIKILSVAFLFCSYSTVLVIWQVFNNYFQLFVQLLCRFSCVPPCVTPETAAHQAPPSLGFSRQEYWSGCNFLLQCMKVKSLSRVLLLATPWTAAYQAPPSMGFFRREYWSGVPLPSSNLCLTPVI